MLSEEEKAIENLKKNRGVSFKEADVLSNLIDNQQKEIEENQVLIDDIKDHRIVYIDTPEFEEKFISKDKIREIIAEYKKQLQSADTERTAIMLSNFIMVLNDLLEEK